MATTFATDSSHAPWSSTPSIRSSRPGLSRCWMCSVRDCDVVPAGGRKVTYMLVVPRCDYHRSAGESVRAQYDAKTDTGRWMYLCEDCFARFGQGLGTGLGQRIIEGSPGAPAE